MYSTIVRFVTFMDRTRVVKKNYKKINKPYLKRFKIDLMVAVTGISSVKVKNYVR